MGHQYKWFFILIFLSMAMCSFGQNHGDWQETPPTPANFARIMKMGPPTDAQFDTIWNVTVQYCNGNKDTCRLLTDHIVAITKNSSNKTQYGEALYLKANAILDIDKEEGVNTLFEAKDILEKENSIQALVKVERLIGTHFSLSNQFQEAIDHLLNAVRLIKTTQDTADFASPLMAVGGVYYKLGHLEKAQQYLSEAAGFLEAAGDEEQLPPILSNQAMIYQRMGTELLAKAETDSNYTEIYRDSAMFFFKKGLDRAEQGLAIAKKLDNPTNILFNMNMMASLKNNMGDYKAATRLSQEVLKMAEVVHVPFFIVNGHLNLCTAQRNLGLFQEALANAKTGYEMAKQNPQKVSLYIFEQELYEIYKALGRPSEALPFLESIFAHQKKLSESNVQKAVADAETKYQTAEKERQILELEVTNEKISKQRNYIMAGGIFLSLLGFFGYQYKKVQKDRNDKKAFAEALIHAQEEERKRIARDLHDGVGQSLLLIKKQLDTNTQVTLENQQMISDTLEEVRSISRDLHPIQLEKFGLTTTINDSISKVEHSTDLFISKEIADIDNCLSPKAEIHLFRTIQETLSNIVKHAGATAAKVTVENREDKIYVNIQDNGKGFDLEMAVVASKSLGIKTMHERISAIGGRLKISKGKNNGMQVEMTIPKKK